MLFLNVYNFLFSNITKRYSIKLQVSFIFLLKRSFLNYIHIRNNIMEPRYDFSFSLCRLLLCGWPLYVLKHTCRKLNYTKTGKHGPNPCLHFFCVTWPLICLTSQIYFTHACLASCFVIRQTFLVHCTQLGRTPHIQYLESSN